VGEIITLSVPQYEDIVVKTFIRDQISSNNYVSNKSHNIKCVVSSNSLFYPMKLITDNKSLPQDWMIPLEPFDFHDTNLSYSDIPRWNFNEKSARKEDNCLFE